MKHTPVSLAEKLRIVKDAGCTHVIADLQDLHVVRSGFSRTSLQALAGQVDGWEVVSVGDYERLLENRLKGASWEPPIDNEVR